MKIEYATLEDTDVAESVSQLCYGASGTGKTHYCGTGLSEHAALINIGAGLTTLKSPLFRQLYPGASKALISTLYETGTPDAPVLMDKVSDVMDDLLRNRPNIRVIFLDDASTLRKAAMMKGIVGNSKTEKSKSLLLSKAAGIQIIAQQDYQAEMSIIEQFLDYYVKACKARNVHFVVTAHERLTFKKGDKSGDQPILIRTAPSFTGVDKNPDYITGIFDEVWHFRVVGGGNRRVYRVDTQGTESLIAKTRWGGVFKAVEENLKFVDVVKRIRETKTPIQG